MADGVRVEQKEAKTETRTGNELAIEKYIEFPKLWNPGNEYSPIISESSHSL